MMNNEQEDFVINTARQFDYPPTPDIAGNVRRQLTRKPRPTLTILRLAAAVMIAVLLVVIAVPEARAWVIEALRIGGIQIFFDESTPLPTATISPSDPVLELSGETTLEDARIQTGFDIALPADLGEPDRVFVRDAGGGVMTLVWLNQDGSVYVVLEILTQEMMGAKFYPHDDREITQVNGDRALWLTGVHYVIYFAEPQDIQRQVNRSVLIWEQDNLTYRLETELTMEEAVAIAESLD